MPPFRTAVAATLGGLLLAAGQLSNAQAAPTPSPTSDPTVRPAPTATPTGDYPPWNPCYYQILMDQAYDKNKDWLGDYRRSGTCIAEFSNGTIDANKYETYLIRDRMWTRYHALDGYTGFLARPTSNQFPVRDGGLVQRFEGGTVYAVPNAGTYVVRDEFLRRYGEFGYENGVLGFPVSDRFCGLRGGGCGQHFQTGSLYQAAPTAAMFAVHGLFRDTWSANGWENGYFGYPMTDEINETSDQVTQRFEGGWMRYNFRTGVLTTGRW
ncbi:LGFP repeat-containing protein [Propionibacteriaceae bacterium ES.041]|uniref:LGFP repeat-containing protein n=1 Tax=Enemella evansiae TaxID=2016499 RepID=UPI000B963065|nr:hypothetical protein [Enemella evansiae]OYN94668.1 hypothetical protein CGZ96_17520 [Enemella evansiae]PFG67741.1 LGFP repeat-containing protein [Propionibacteriaceae bacterium ES.041]